MDDPDPGNNGLARERTDLAWNRSGLAVVVCIAVLLRRIWPLHGPGRFVALGCISAGAVAWALALSVGRTLWSGAQRRTHLSSRRAAVITVGTLALALAATALTLLSPP